MTNGIKANYVHISDNKKWTYEVGVMFAVNGYKYNDNKNNHVYYQTGHATNFAQRWGVNGRISYKVFEYKKISVHGMANLVANYSALKCKSPPVIGRSYHDIKLSYAAPALEITLGPTILYNINHNISLYAIKGFGYAYFRHNKGISLLTGEEFESYHLNPNNPNQKGSGEVVGIEGLFPMFEIGVRYRL